jgi:hypothetical protein
MTCSRKLVFVELFARLEEALFLHITKQPKLTSCEPWQPLKKSREAQSCGFGVPLASRATGESTDSSRIRDVDGAPKTLL